MAHVQPVVSSKAIPKIIHQIWLDPKNPDTKGPPSSRATYHDYIREIKVLHPDYEYRWWNLNEIKSLWLNPEVAKFKEVFDRLPHLIMKCDFIRYVIMYVHGGFYFDCDTKFRRHLPDQWLHQRFIFVQEPPHISGGQCPGLFQTTGFSGYISNNFFGSVPGDQLWLNLLQKCRHSLNQHSDTIKIRDVINITGPRQITHIVTENQAENCIIPSYLIYGLDYDGDEIPCQGYPECRENKWYPKNIREISIASNTWRDGTNWGLNVWWSNNSYLKIILIILIAVIIAVLFIFLVFLMYYFLERDEVDSVLPMTDLVNEKYCDSLALKK